MPVLTPKQYFAAPTLPSLPTGPNPEIGLTVARYEDGNFVGSFGVSVGFSTEKSFASLTAAGKLQVTNSLIAACTSPSSQICVLPKVCSNSSTAVIESACVGNPFCTTQGVAGTSNWGYGHAGKFETAAMIGIEAGDFVGDAYALCLTQAIEPVMQKAANSLQANATTPSTTSISASSSASNAVAPSAKAPSKNSAMGSAKVSHTALMMAALAAVSLVLKNA